jgi:hypothetical protein
LAGSSYDLERMDSGQIGRTSRPGSWRTAALLAAGLLVVLGVMCRSALADNDLPRDPPTQEPTAPETLAPEAPAIETPGRADESGPVQTPARPAMLRPKMDGALAAIAEAAATAGDEAALAATQARGLTIVGGTIRVLVECVSTDLANTEATILAAGGAVEGSYGDTIQALIPPGGLDQVAASPDVRYVRAPAGRVPDGAPAPGRTR